MKRIFSYLIAMLLFQSVLSAQISIEGGCTEVTIDASTIPTFDQDLYNISRQSEPCRAVVSNPGGTMKAKMTLQRLNSNGQFVTVSSFPQFPPNNTWSNLSHGTYRVRVSIPKAIVALNCISGWINIYSVNGQYLGRRGEYPEIDGGENSTVFYSNAVVVGNTVPADNSYTFIDEPEQGGENLYEYGEIVKINTSACSNYNQWWVAIFESDPNGRYASNGWSYGTIPNNEVNLTDVWQKNHPNWEFEINRSYTVQFVVENQQCLNGSGWNVNERSFFICSPQHGQNCRAGKDSGVFSITPNPANTSIRFQNFELDLGWDYRVLVTDLYGKVAKSVKLTDTYLDISDLPNGMFVVNIIRDGQPIHQTKLVVSHR